MSAKPGDLFRILREPWGLALGLCILTFGLMASGLFTLLPIVVTQVGHLDKAQVVLFFLINIAAGIAITLTTGWLSDGKVSKVTLVLVCGVVSVGGYAGLAAGGSFGLLCVFGALSSGGLVLFSQFFAVGQAGVMKLWPQEAKVLGTTILRTLFSLGFVLGTSLSSFLLLFMNISALYWFLSGAVLIVTLGSAFVVARIEVWARALSNSSKSEAPPSSPSHAVQDVSVSTGVLIIGLVAVSLMQGADRTRLVYLPLVTFDAFHDARWAPLIFSFTAAFEIVTIVFAGWIATRIGETRTIAAGAVLGAVSFVLMALFMNLPALFASNFIYSFFAAGVQGVSMAYIQGLLAHRPGWGGSLYVTTTNVGALAGILAPLLVPGYSPATFFLPAGLCLIAALLMLKKS